MKVNLYLFLQFIIFSIDIYQGSPFVSVYYVIVYYILSETLARYRLDAC